MNKLTVLYMKKSSIIFLQVVLVLIGAGVLALMLWEPHVEGRNANSTIFQIYFNDPFLAYAYAASLSFFVGLYQAFRLLGYIGDNKVFSLKSVKALRTIKYCAMLLVGSIALPLAHLFIVRSGDDIAGGVAIGVVLIFVSTVIGTAAAVFERTLQNAVEIKSENDLTV